MEETISKANRARVNQEVDSFNRQSTIYKEELKNSRQNTENLYRNVDQFIGQAMEVNNDLEDFVNQESNGRSGKGRDIPGQRVSADNFKSYRSAKMYNTTFTETAGNKDKMYFNRSVDKSLRSKSQTSLDGKEYLYTANRRLQTYEEWMMLKWQEMKDKSLHTVRWTPVRVDPPKEIDLTKPPPAKDVKILYREYDSKSGRINKVVATNPDGAKIEFRADPVAESPEPPAKTPGPKGRKTPGNKNRKVDNETAAAYKLPAYNFGGYNDQKSGYQKKPLKFIHPSSREKKERVPA